MVLDETKRPALDNVSLAVRRGEILGVAGVEGNGQGELIEAILGLRSIEDGGQILLDGEEISTWSVRRRREALIGYVPEDRHRRGLLLDAPLWENAMLGHQTMEPFARGPLLDRRRSREATTRIVKDFDVRTPSIDTSARALSGGNQQKLVLAKWLQRNCEVIVIDEPTRGIDVGAKYEIYLLINELAAAGKAIVMISSELPEVLGIADRVLVMRQGRVSGEIDDPQNATQEQVMELAAN